MLLSQIFRCYIFSKMFLKDIFQKKNKTNKRTDKIKRVASIKILWLFTVFINIHGKKSKAKKKKIKKKTIRTNKLLKKGRKRIIEKSVKTERKVLEL